MPDEPTKPAPSLKALAEKKEEGITKITIFRVDPNKIELEEGFNLRAENTELQEHIGRLYESMKNGASVPPVDVQMVEGRILARDGHCRIRAARRLRSEQPEFTLEVRQLRGNDVDALMHMLGTGTGGKPLSPLEAGKGYLRAVKMFGLKVSEIAKRLGVSRPTVESGLALAEAPAEVQQLVSDGKVSSTVARQAVKQGKAGVAALTEAAKKEETAPKTKSKKAGKVTAKKLQGTKAAKPAKKGADKPTKATTPPTQENVTTTPPAPVNPDQITIVVSKETATAVFEFLRDFGGEGNGHVDAMKSQLEAALL